MGDMDVLGNWKFITLFLILSLVAGLHTGGGDAVAYIEAAPYLIQSLEKDEGLSSPSRGTSHIIEYPEGPIYQVLKPNISTLVDDWRTPVYKVETNSEGLRESSFDFNPKPGTTRILVLGDSYTYGWGVNRSDRYTDILEKRLNRRLDGRYEVINAGVLGYGMKDMYMLLRHRVIEYNPDIVVVSFGPNDWISRERWDRSIREAEKIIKEEYNTSAMSDREVIQAYGGVENRIRQRMFDRVNMSDSELLNYMTRMEDLSRSHNFTLIFYSYSLFEWEARSDRTYHAIKDWESQHPSKVIWAPEKFDHVPRIAYTLEEKEPHYNSLGHRWLADKLYRNLRPILLRED